MAKKHRIPSATCPAVVALVLTCLFGCEQVPPRWPTAHRRSDGEGPSASPTLTEQADVQAAMGRAAEQQGDLQQAAASYQAALKNDRNRSDTCRRLAVVLDRLGQFTESAGWYRQALELSPGDPDVFCDMGYSLYLQKRWGEAEMNLNQALALRPDHARAHNNLGLVLVHQGKAREALSQFVQAGNTLGQAHNNLAFALSVEGQAAEARRQYELAQIADPASTTARDRLRELDSLVARVKPLRPPAGRDDRLVKASAAATPVKKSASRTAPPPGSTFPIDE